MPDQDSQQAPAFDEVDLTPEEQALKDSLAETRKTADAHPDNQIPNSGGAPAPAGFSIEQFEEFARLHAEKKRLDGELRAIKDGIAALQEPLMEQLMSSGMPQIRLNSGALISTKKTVTVKAGTSDESASEADWNRACDVLEEIGMGDFSKRRFLQPTLKSWIGQLMKDADAEGRDYDDVEELLPPELAAVITTGVLISLNATGV